MTATQKGHLVDMLKEADALAQKIDGSIKQIQHDQNNLRMMLMVIQEELDRAG